MTGTRPTEDEPSGDDLGLSQSSAPSQYPTLPPGSPFAPPLDQAPPPNPQATAAGSDNPYLDFSAQSSGALPPPPGTPPTTGWSREPAQSWSAPAASSHYQAHPPVGPTPVAPLPTAQGQPWSSSATGPTQYGPPPPRKNTGLRNALLVAGGAALALVVAVVAILSLSRDADPVPTAEPPSNVEPSELAPVWTSADLTVLNEGIDGFAWDGPPVVVTEEVLVVRVGSSSYDAPASAVVGLARADGSQAWQVDLEGAVCAETVIELDGGTLGVVCAGANRVLTLDVASGEVQREFAAEFPTRFIAASQSGVLQIGETNPDSGSTIALWTDVDGNELWQEDLALRSEFDRDLMEEDGTYELYELTRTATAQGSLFSSGSAAFFASDAGLVATEMCWVVYVDDDGYICGNGRDGSTKTSWTGEVLWKDGASLAAGTQWGVPAMLTDPWYEDEPYVRVADPASGDPGVEVLDADELELVFTLGTPDVTMLHIEDTLYVLDQDEVAWQVESDHGRSAIQVVGDRVVVPSEDFRSVGVYEADSGTQVATLDGLLMDCTPIGGRELFCPTYRGADLYLLP